MLVPEERALDAVALREERGWWGGTLAAVKLGDFFLSYRQSADFTRQAQERIDLHWHVLFQACHREADQLFWEASVPVEFEGIATRALCPTGRERVWLLLHGEQDRPDELAVLQSTLGERFHPQEKRAFPGNILITVVLYVRTTP